MKKLIVTGIDGNLGRVAAKEIQKLVPAERLSFCSYNENALKPYEKVGIKLTKLILIMQKGYGMRLRMVKNCY